MSGLVGALVAGGGTLLAMLILGWALMRGGVGRWGVGLVFAAGSVLGFAGIVWSVVIAVAVAGGNVLDALLRAVGNLG